MSDDVQKAWARFLDPDVLRGNLVFASLYIAAYEVLSNTIVDEIREFFTFGFGPDGPHVDPKYQADVLSRHKSRVGASVAWLREHNVIDDTDLHAMDDIRQARNELAHEMHVFVTTGPNRDYGTLFDAMRRINHKVAVWWAFNVHAATDPTFDNVEVDPGQIMPGSSMMLQLLVDIALGDPERSNWYAKEFAARFRPSGSPSGGAQHGAAADDRPQAGDRG